jgi:indoleamine 2,3-dioxygenase
MQVDIPDNHFLNLPRPDVFASLPAGVVDTTTLAAHDFDVDTRTGFMPPQVPVMRLDVQYDPWEDVLNDAISKHLQLGEKVELDEEEKLKSEKWRDRVRNVSSSHSSTARLHGT